MFKSIFIISLLLIQNLAMANADVDQALKSYRPAKDSEKIKKYANVPSISLNCPQALYGLSQNGDPEAFCTAFLNKEIKKIKDLGFKIIDNHGCISGGISSKYTCFFRFN